MTSSPHLARKTPTPHLAVPAQAHYAWLWDVDMSNEEFDAILAGRATRGAFDTRWAIIRLVEYAPWRELKQRLPHQLFLHYWPEIRQGVRSDGCREGMDFMYERWRGQQ